MKRVILLTILGSIMTLTSAQAAPANDIVTEAIVKAATDEVWRAFTTKNGIESWMVAKTDIDLSIGGTWRTSYSKDSNLNDDAAIHQMILAFDPGRMFAFRTIKPPKNFPFPNAIAKTWTVVYFEPAGERQTRVIVRMLGYGDDAEAQKMRPFFEMGNKATLDSLVKRFQ